MSEFYFNEKEGRYDPINEASLGARMKAARRSRDDLSEAIRQVEKNQNPTYQSMMSGYHTSDVEKAARQTSDFTSYKNEAKKEPQKKKKSGLVSLGFLVWIIYMIFKSDAGESIRRFFEDLFQY